MKDDNKSDSQDMTQSDITRSSASPSNALSIDWALYEDLLKDSDLTEDQKHDFIEALWSIVVSFVDLGFGIHPLQSVHNSQIDLTDLLETASGDVVNSTSSKSTFMDAAGHQTDRFVERKES